MDRGYPHNIKENLLSQTNLKERKEEKDTIPALSVTKSNTVSNVFLSCF